MAAPVPVVTAASIDQRFAQLIQQFGLTKNSFAISLGKTASVVQHLIDGRNKPGFDLMCKVFEVYPNVSRDWLLLGRGPMLVGSNGSTAPPVAPAEPAAPEPDFEPIDLADVALRATRRPSALRLHPEQIAATLVLASAAADGAAPAPVPASTVDLVSGAGPETTQTHARLPAPFAVGTMAAAPAAAPAPVVPASVQRPARPFRAALAPAARPPAEPAPEVAATPLATPEPEIPAPTPVSVPVSAPLAAPVSAAPALTNSPDAYVAAAIHAQHLQHQLALAEMRNQHLLEQQQMLREMLAMARQNMV